MSERSPVNQSKDNITLAKLDDIIKRKYLRYLSSLTIKPLPENLRCKTSGNSTCFFPVIRIVYDRKENNLQKIMNVYVGAASIDASIAMIIHHPEKSRNVGIYIGICDEKSFDAAKGKARILFSNLMGNFPGIQTGKNSSPFLTPKETDELAKKCFCSGSGKYHSVSCVSGVASLRADMKQDNSTFFQGIEKLIDGMEHRAYSVIILASSLSYNMIADMQAEHENLYHMLSPHARISVSLSNSASKSASKAVSEASSEVLSNTKSTTLSIGKSRTESASTGKHEDSGNSVGVYGGISVLGGGYSHSWSRGENWSKSTAIGKTDTLSGSEATTKGTTTTISSTDGKTFTITTGNSHQINFENKTVLELMAITDRKIKRLHAGMEHGMFAVSAYFISSDLQGTVSAASIYKSLITGDNSHIESSVINSWSDKDYDAIKEYLIRFCHPVLLLKDNTEVTPASVVTVGELAIHMGLPWKSVMGIPVSYSTSFGRSIHHVSSINIENDNGEKIRLGNLWHLGIEEENEVSLDLQSMAMHTLLCGTTGTGKSNAAYLLLQNLPDSVKFLVIEPAKGEYKDTLTENVSVYGTNPYISQMLKINPFRFCRNGRGIHILEHIDRLTAIFNVCWPMEAAMPSVLKKAVERAYVAAGWDMKRSENIYGKDIFPTLEDVMHEVNNIIKASKYSAETKGDYIGALCTRLEELTTGINAMIFTPNDIADSELFDSNVIADISRIGSAETKALIMGMLLIRLQEYRQCMTEHANTSLRHVTVIEEAHHLLRNTIHSECSANIISRSVEMLSNTFAEMRTYGEGFIIVDQSPEQLDKSVIRNTNTKIILRLPEYEDRKSVGKSIGLSEEQISELSKIPDGVAVVQQNNWLEGVLVKIRKADAPVREFRFKPDDDVFAEDSKKEELYNVIRLCSIDSFKAYLDDYGVVEIAVMNIPARLKCAIMDYQRSEESKRKEAFINVLYEFFNFENILSDVMDEGILDFASLKVEVMGRLPMYPNDNEDDNMFSYMFCEYQNRNKSDNRIYKLQS